MPAGPDSDGLRHQLKGVPAGQIAVGSHKRRQNALRTHGYAANGALIRDALDRFQQQHRRIVG
ncbi:hypothetical protein D3C85_1698760 [compost metagenome]